MNKSVTIIKGKYRLIVASSVGVMLDFVSIVKLVKSDGPLEMAKYVNMMRQ